MSESAGTAESSRGPELLGVRIRNSGPIEEAFVDLMPGLSILYGTNGAGKTFVLEGIRQAFAGTGNSELHFRCPPDAWRFPDLHPVEALAARRPHERENSYERLIEDLAFRLCGRTFDTAGDKANELRAVVQLALEMNADTESLMAAMFEIVSSYRFARVGDSIAQVALSDPVDSPALSALATEAFMAARDLPSEELQELLSADEGPDIGGGVYDGRQTSFVGLTFLRSAVRRAAGAPTPPWLGDIVRRQPSWGVWPEPIVDPDVPIHLGYLAVEVIDVLRRSRPQSDVGTPLERAVYQLVNSILGFDQSLIRPTLRASEIGAECLLDESCGSFRIASEAESVLGTLSRSASDNMRRLLPDPPVLKCSILPLPKWGTGFPIRWTGLDRSGSEVDFSMLSAAQRRWATLAIRLAAGTLVGEATPIILIDEPESGLHRHAERHLARGLAELTDSTGAVTIVVTHSPSMLDQRRAHLLHVRRNDAGRTVVDPLEPQYSARLRELGLSPADVLNRCRTALLVEGRHEEVILGRLFGDELARAGVEIFSVRGAKNLRTASDAQLLFRYTEAELLVVVDNQDPRRIADIWQRAREAKAMGSDFDLVLREFNRGKSAAEAQFIKEFCAEALHKDRVDRLAVTSLRLPDVTEYLPLHAIAPNAPTGATWQELHELHDKAAAGVYFKTWLERSFGADFSEASLLAAIDAMDTIHADLIDLLNLATGASPSP